MRRYEQIDISGDVGLRIWGQTLEGLFANAAEGMYELMTDHAGIEEKERKEVSLSSGSIEDLFVQWLNELVFLFDTYGFIGKKYIVKIHGIDPHSPASGTNKNSGALKVEAKVSGGIFNREINESRLLIKAATYHGLSIEKVNSLWEAEVIFDI